MFENIIKFFKKFGKNEKEDSKDTAKERLHLVSLFLPTFPEMKSDVDHI